MPTIATGLKVSIANTPQAKDDVAGGLEDFSALLDVLLNDLGGAAKSLYSLSKYLTIEDGGTVTAASMISALPVQTVTTDLGSTATIIDGKISYVTNGLDYLGEGETATDQFSYIIRLSSGAFSVAVVTITLTGSNDAPVISVVGTDSASAAINETNAGLTATGTLTVSDPDTTDTVDVAVTGLVVGGDGGTGGLSNDDLLAMLSLSGNVDNAADGTQGSLQWDFDSGSETFDYLAAGEVLVLTYTLTATDDAPLTPLSDTQTVTITITGTNDAPVLIVDASGSVAEDIAVVGGLLTDSGPLSFTDADVTDTHLVTTGVTSVVWSGGSLSPAVQAALAAGFSADADGWDYSVANSAVQFLDDGETITLTLTVTVTDDSDAANDSDTETVTITIAGTNDAPELTASAASLAEGLEDNSYTVTQAELLAGWTDIDGETLSITGLTATNGMVVANGDGSYTITPSANYYGPVTLNYSVSDGTAPVPASLSYTLAPVNDAPSGADKTVTILEDGSHVFSAADFGFSDPVEGDDLAAVVITTLPGAGSLKLNGVAVSAGQSVSAADIAAGLLVYAPAANANGAGYASFTFQVRDNGGTANGGVDTDQSPNTISFNVTPVNDAPAGANGNVSTLEDTAKVLTIADFGFSDPNDVPANDLLAVKIATLPTSGFLTLNGVAVTVGQFVSATDITAGLLVYAPPGNNTGNASFTFQVQDNGGTANGGANLDASANMLVIDFIPVNDAPFGANKTVTANEDAGFQFSAADFGFTDPNDGAAPNSLAAVKITTLPGNGSLNLNGSAVTAGQFVSIADINAGLLVFTPTANANGAAYASFTFQVQDDGGTANGGVDTDPSPNTITINVNPVNDAPVNAVPGAQSVDEDTALAIAGVSVGDIDSANLITTLSVDHGTLDVANIIGLGISGDGTGTVVLTGSAAQINLALAGLSYTGGLDYFGPDTLTVETDDGDLTDTDTVAITVYPVADAPVETRVNNAADDKDFDLYTDVAALASVAMGTTNGTTAADLLVGTNGNETINGNNGNDIIHGAGGTDTVNGNNNDDTLYGGAGVDTINGGGGADTIYGGSGNDIITGVGGNETIYGGSGNDDISGGAGVDQLWGGTGQDDFIFAVGDSSVAAPRDRINDFSHAEDDNINLTAFTNFTAADWLGIIANPGALTSGGLGYVVNLDGSLTLYGDHDGNGVADFAVDIIGVGSLQTGDFIFGGP